MRRYPDIPTGVLPPVGVREYTMQCRGNGRNVRDSAGRRVRPTMMAARLVVVPGALSGVTPSVRQPEASGGDPDHPRPGVDRELAGRTNMEERKRLVGAHIAVAVMDIFAHLSQNRTADRVIWSDGSSG